MQWSTIDSALLCDECSDGGAGRDITSLLIRNGGMYMWETVAGGGVLVVYDGRVLLVARQRDGLTRWELPLGILEACETFETTAVREALEETGISVAITSLLCTVVMDVPAEEYRGINLYFRADAIDDACPRRPNDEPISCAAYVEPASLRSRDIHPVDRRILNLCAESQIAHRTTCISRCEPTAQSNRVMTANECARADAYSNLMQLAPAVRDGRVSPTLRSPVGRLTRPRLLRYSTE